MKPISKYIALADKKMMEGKFDDDSEPLLDDSYRQPVWMHCSSLARSFSDAIFGADPWKKRKKYTLPPNFENVINWICFNISREFTDTTVKISPVEATEKLMVWASDNPFFKNWETRFSTRTIRLNCLHLLRDEAFRMAVEKRRFIQEKTKNV